MELLTIIYILAAAAVGVLAGMIIETIADEVTLRRQDKQIELLKLRVEELESENGDKVQVIEINDNRAQPESYFTPF